MRQNPLSCLQSVQKECDKRGIVFQGYQYQGAHSKSWNEALIQFQAEYLSKNKKWLNDDEVRQKLKTLSSPIQGS